ncbi:macro domain-containing protein [Candidatus Woesearchaeota archaeon]|nr:macro domain-containing protein [Candidatus Woesearchaeota archaeon]
MQIEVVQGDITLQDTDAIANSANSTLSGGGGVDGAIHRASGPRLLAACQQVREARFPKGLPEGEAVLTPGFDLRAKYVIHAVGPQYAEKGRSALSRAFTSALRIADEKGLNSVALPAIGTGAYGWPKKVAAEVLREALGAFRPKSLQLVRVVLLTADDYLAFRSELEML